MSDVSQHSDSEFYYPKKKKKERKKKKGKSRWLYDKMLFTEFGRAGRESILTLGHGVPTERHGPAHIFHTKIIIIIEDKNQFP